MGLRRERLLPDGERHRKAADIPDEPAEFTGDRDYRDVLLLATRYQLSITSAQAQLRVPGSIHDGLGNAFVSALDLRTHSSRVLVAPRRFDEQLPGISVSILGNASLTAFLT